RRNAGIDTGDHLVWIADAVFERVQYLPFALMSMCDVGVQKICRSIDHRPVRRKHLDRPQLQHPGKRRKIGGHVAAMTRRNDNGRTLPGEVAAEQNSLLLLPKAQMVW